MVQTRLGFQKAHREFVPGDAASDWPCALQHRFTRPRLHVVLLPGLTQPTLHVHTYCVVTLYDGLLAHAALYCTDIAETYV